MPASPVHYATTHCTYSQRVTRPSPCRTAEHQSAEQSPPKYHSYCPLPWDLVQVDSAAAHSFHLPWPQLVSIARSARVFANRGKESKEALEDSSIDVLVVRACARSIVSYRITLREEHDLWARKRRNRLVRIPSLQRAVQLAANFPEMFPIIFVGCGSGRAMMVPEDRAETGECHMCSREFERKRHARRVNCSYSYSACSMLSSLARLDSALPLRCLLSTSR